MGQAPIALFLYRRLEHSVRTVEALQANPEAKTSDLFVFCDGARSEKDSAEVDAVRSYARRITGFRSVSVIEAPGNRGLSAAIMSGVGQILGKFDRVVVIEDDIVCSRPFLSWVNKALDRYEREDRVFCISGYVYPIELAKGALPFFLLGADCWGWATWKRAWSRFRADGGQLRREIVERKLRRRLDFDNTYPYMRMLEDQIARHNDSWAIRWYASALLSDGYCLYPPTSLVENTGLDGSGTHSHKSRSYESQRTNIADWDLPDVPESESREGYEAFKTFFRRERPSIARRLLARVCRVANSLCRSGSARSQAI